MQTKRETHKNKRKLTKNTETDYEQEQILDTLAEIALVALLNAHPTNSRVQVTNSIRVNV